LSWRQRQHLAGVGYPAEQRGRLAAWSHSFCQPMTATRP